MINLLLFHCSRSFASEAFSPQKINKYTYSDIDVYCSQAKQPSIKYKPKAHFTDLNNIFDFVLQPLVIKIWNMKYKFLLASDLKKTQQQQNVKKTYN